MSLATFEAVVENGQIKLPENVHVPERTRVYVVVPGPVDPGVAKVMSPRLADPKQAKDFDMTVMNHLNLVFNGPALVWDRI